MPTIEPLKQPGYEYPQSRTNMWNDGLSGCPKRALSDNLADSLPVGTGVYFRLAQPSLTDPRNICQNGYICIFRVIM